MLVLSRKRRERIIVTTIETIQPGEKIEIVITDVRGKNVRLGFEASDKFNIMREELGETNGSN